MHLFFFSSRRRHTRCSRDWSSDVCSSDLTPDSGSPAPARQALANPIARIMSFRDSLGLSAEQVAVLHAIADSLDVLSQSMRRALQHPRAVLPPEQGRKVPDPPKSPEAPQTARP